VSPFQTGSGGFKSGTSFESGSQFGTIAGGYLDPAVIFEREKQQMEAWFNRITTELDRKGYRSSNNWGRGDSGIGTGESAAALGHEGLDPSVSSMDAAMGIAQGMSAMGLGPIGSVMGGILGGIHGAMANGTAMSGVLGTLGISPAVADVLGFGPSEADIEGLIGMSGVEGVAGFGEAADPDAPGLGSGNAFGGAFGGGTEAGGSAPGGMASAGSASASLGLGIGESAAIGALGGFGGGGGGSSGGGSGGNAGSSNGPGGYGGGGSPH